jgi:hypothetical protein
MVAQQHMGYVDALRYGTARTQATIAAALAAIGAAPATLVWTLTGDGIWTLASNITTPSNVTNLIPAGVTVGGTGNLTMNGPLIASSPSWYVGSGTVTRSITPGPEITNLVSNQISVRTTLAGQGLVVENSTSAAAKRVKLLIDNGAGNVGISLSQVDNQTSASWQIMVPLGGGLVFARPGATYIAQINDNGLAIGGSITPSSWLLQVAGDGTTNSAAKPTGGSWSNSASDIRVKTVDGVYPRGLPFVRSLPPIKIYRYNGKAGTPTDDQPHVGFIADDLLPIVPEWIFTSPVKLEPDDPTPVDLKGLNDSELLYAVTNALKELADMHDEVADRVTALEGVAGRHAAEEETPEDQARRASRPARRQRRAG